MATELFAYGRGKVSNKRLFDSKVVDGKTKDAQVQVTTQFMGGTVVSYLNPQEAAGLEVGQEYDFQQGLEAGNEKGFFRLSGQPRFAPGATVAQVAPGTQPRRAVA